MYLIVLLFYSITIILIVSYIVVTPLLESVVIYTKSYKQESDICPSTYMINHDFFIDCHLRYNLGFMEIVFLFFSFISLIFMTISLKTSKYPRMFLYSYIINFITFFLILVGIA